jgi:hypothetical protein
MDYYFMIIGAPADNVITCYSYLRLIGLQEMMCVRHKSCGKQVLISSVIPISLRTMDITFDTWNIRGLYRAGSLMTVAKEISKYKLDLVGVQEVRWDKVGTEPAGEYTFFYGKGNANHELGVCFLYVRESYQALRGQSLLVIGCT